MPADDFNRAVQPGLPIPPPSEGRLAEIERRLKPMHHYGDPCVHCGTPHDEVEIGPCHGDRSKAIPIAYRLVNTRWDGVERYWVRMSTGEVVERHEHYSYMLPFNWLKGVRYDESLKWS